MAGHLRGAAALLTGIAGASVAAAQPPQSGTGPATAPVTADGTERDAKPDEIVVVGSQIQGSKVTAALPVTVVTQTDVVATGAVSGDELFRSIPQLGDVTFNSAYLPNSSNSARGDVGSVNLRNLGVGNTLVLLNGRRVVTHPVSQADTNLVPVLTYNTNAIPVAGLKRLEVLRDGAAAIYGSDAVAGVVNTVLQDDYKGLSMEAQYGFAQGTSLHELTTNLLAGTDLNGGRGNITLFADYTRRSILDAASQDYTASSDKRPLFAGTRFQGAASLDTRTTTTDWAALGTPVASGTLRRGTTALTTAAGLFHIGTPAVTGSACAAAVPSGGCIATGAVATSGAERDLRYDTLAATNSTILPGVDRGNIFATAKYEIAPQVELFGEAGLYLARSRAYQAPSGTLSSQPITIPATNFYNPFGPAGSPGRLSGLTNVPAGGLPVSLRTYLFADAGANYVTVRNSQYRLLGGLRWQWLGFRWESAALYSRARVHDRSDGISATLLQQQLGLATPDAYNPFNGGGPAAPSLADTTPSTPAALAAIRIRTDRVATSSLALADLKASRTDLLHLPGGDLGIAVGGEIRRETQRDDRDARVDGTITFRDSVTGAVGGSDLVGTSPSPDTRGHRTVAAAYAELAIPVIGRDMNVPFVRAIDLQAAARFEHYSDVGSVVKPKVAGSWDVVDGVRLRGSYAESFKAPNLEQLNATLVTRSNTRTDYVRCEADLRARRITSFANCSRTLTVSAQRSGNPDLDPETSRTVSGGIVLEPRFVPPALGRFTVTADYWNVHQKGIVGLFGEGNALILDYLLRTQGGSNPNVIRAAPTSDDTAAFAGTGLAPVGQVLYVTDQYVNLLPQKVSGWDFGLSWRSPETGLGRFDLTANIAYLKRFYLEPSAGIATLLAARASGQINAGTTITGGGNLLRQQGRPRWKASGTLTWSYGPVQVGAYTQYTGSVDDTDLIDGVGNPWLIEDQLTANLYAQVEVGQSGGRQLRLRLGVRNLTDAKPPLAAAGYLATLYNPYARYWYMNVRTSF